MLTLTVKPTAGLPVHFKLRLSLQINWNSIIFANYLYLGELVYIVQRDKQECKKNIYIYSVVLKLA